MGVPTSEVGYTIATTRRENHEVHKNRWWHWGGKNGTIAFVFLPYPWLFAEKINRKFHEMVEIIK